MLIFLVGNKRKASEVGSQSQSVPHSVSASSSAIKNADQVVGTSTGGGSGPGTEVDGGNTNPSTQEPGVVAAADIVVLDGDDDEEKVVGSSKRAKRCTSAVWKYFTKRTIVIEEGGKKYEQLWGHCNFPHCKHKYMAESNNGTNVFRNHLKSCHSIVKGQMQLRAKKDLGKDVSTVVPYIYDYETSLKKFYLAVIMHEYPFNIVEHDYFVDFINSLHPSFTFKSRVTGRKDIMDIYETKKNKLYAYLKTVKCRFSATMDMWTSCQNKGYMCVTLHWIDDEWRIQKRIVGFFHVEGRHTGHKLSESFTETMVKWFVEQRLFALTLDNASNNFVAATDIVADLQVNEKASLVCDGIFFSYYMWLSHT